MNILSVKNLTFSYDNKRNILNGIDFSIKKGTITAFLGKNGSGKSTLLDNIIGVHSVQEDTIYICDKDLSKLSPTERSRLVAYVPQSSTVNMDFTVFEYILFGRNCHIPFGKAPSKEDYDKVYYYAEVCGITGLLDKDVNKISGGEKQLACIARALTQESSIIIMDEPTASLDFGNQAKILNLMISLKNDGKTIMFTTHNPNYLLDIDCEVVILSEGKILKSGRACETIDVEVLKAIYGEFVLESCSRHFSYKV